MKMFWAFFFSVHSASQNFILMIGAILIFLLSLKTENSAVFFPKVEWINHFGRLYTYSQSSDDFRYTTRACFENFNRIDFVFTTEGKWAEVNKWSSIPFSSGVKILFSRSEFID